MSEFNLLYYAKYFHPLCGEVKKKKKFQVIDSSEQ